MTQVLEHPDVLTGNENDLNFEHHWQVIIWNDEVHSYQEVIEALMKTFGHTIGVAQVIMKEANDTGKAIAEVEDHEKAQLHKDQLQAYIPPFTVHIEPIDYA